MITTYQELKEAFESFNDNNDEFPPDVDVVPCGSENANEYSLIYTGEESKDFELPISHEDFEILCAEFWDYIDWFLEVLLKWPHPYTIAF